VITGRIDGRRAVLSLTLLSPDRHTRESIDFTLDTGFDGFLTVPAAIVASPRLGEAGLVIVTLADGSDIDVPVYTGRVEWDGASRDVDVLATDGRPLLGTRMLSGHEVVVQFVAGEDVIVRPLG
jgi:clan AA aspartic protease